MDGDKATPLLSVRNIDKRFGGITALDNVSMDFFAGETHCVIGENGAGKSTLMKIISGIYSKDSGEITFEGRNVEPKNVWHMFQNGIAIVLQEPGVVGTLTVAENLFLNNEKQFSRAGVLSLWKRKKAAEKVLKNIGVDYIDVTKRVSSLPYEQWKLIELARAKTNPGLRVLIIDETTAALTIDGQKILFDQLNEMKGKGVAVLFVSHRLKEVFQIADRITVMKDAKHVKTMTPDETRLDDLPSLMVGRELKHYYRDDWQASHDGELLISVRNLSVSDFIRDVSFDLHKGEILGIGGLVGSGMHVLGRTLFGLQHYTGEISVNGQLIQLSGPGVAMKHGIGFIPRERDKEGLIPMHVIKDNISLPNMDLVASRGMKQLVNLYKKRQLARDYMEKLSIKAPNVNTLCINLSGGNRQKVVVSKWLARNTDIFIMACPTRGVDVGVKAQIYRLMESLKEQGKGIIMITEELPELIGMSDRILVFKEGVISREFERSKELNEEQVVVGMI